MKSNKALHSERWQNGAKFPFLGGNTVISYLASYPITREELRLKTKGDLPERAKHLHTKCTINFCSKMIPAFLECRI